MGVPVLRFSASTRSQDGHNRPRAFPVWYSDRSGKGEG